MKKPKEFCGIDDFGMGLAFIMSLKSRSPNPQVQLF